jgi:molybdopterin converting factor subunit 1
MRVTVLYFGVLQDVIGHRRVEMELAEGASVADLLTVHRGRVAASVWDSVAVAVNQEYAKAGDSLQDGDEVALLPPVSGGGEGSRGMRVEIVDDVIPAAEIVAEIKAGADGAVCVFDGIVRDNTRGRKTLYLDYEAYREMALEKMRGLAAEAVTRFGVRDVTLMHRLGRLVVGETSVLVVVASAHRGAGFDACRWLIDTLKQTVPIWKKEQFVDGAVWADGEAFPEEVALPKDVRVGARLADGEIFPEAVALPKDVRVGAQLADGEAFPEEVALPRGDGSGEESGRPSDDAHISESRYGAPGSVVKLRSGGGR